MSRKRLIRCRPGLWSLLLIAFLAAGCAPSSASRAPVKVYFAGPEGSVKTALGLGGSFQIVSEPAQAEALVIQGQAAEAGDLGELIRQGKGAVIFLDETVDAARLEALSGVPVELQAQETPVSLAEAAGAAKTDILWNSAPQVRQRFTSLTPLSSASPLATSYEDGSWVLWQARAGVFICNAFLGEDNPQLQEWAYFNYMVYALTMQAAGQTPLSFAAYPASPVPHTAERVALILVMGGALAAAFVIFSLVRRYSLAHPEALDALVLNRQDFNQREAQTGWEEIGFHRPLGGFLLALVSGLVLFIPLIIYQNLILPVYILPSAQALGIWGRVTQFFNLLWWMLDMGTSAAFIKFFAAYRVSEPRKAIQFGQVFVWWQALSGAAQVMVVTLVAGGMLPQTVYALYAWSVIVHTLIQIPGFYQVMRHALIAWQRFDYAQIIEIALYLLLPMTAQPVIVGLMVLWGRSQPAYGAAMGGLIGLGLAVYAVEALAFLLGLWLYRRVGYNARLLFLAHFDWQVIQEAFRFGVFEMLGSVAWAVGQAMEIVVTQTRLVNYTEIWGNWGVAQNFIFAFNISTTFYNNLMPALSEAVSHSRRALSQYYAVMAYKWGGMLSVFVGAVLLAVADRFILGASGPEFTRAAGYVIPLAIWGAIQYPSWVGDNVQRGANRPQWIVLLVAMEQIIRVALAYALIERFQITALIIGYFVGLLTKDIVSYFVNHRWCFPQRFYLWQSLIAPLLAGAAHWAILRWLTGYLWQGDQITSVLIFFIGILPSFPIYAFFYGLFGGWDEATLDELKQAVALSGFVRPLAWLFWWASERGARLSPLHNRFPITIRAEALAEARSLTEERVHV